MRDDSGRLARSVEVETDRALAGGSTQLPGPPLERDVNEVLLFHGTHPIAAERIADSKFQINLAGSNAGSLYGRGIYLSENSSKSDEYSRPDSRGLCTALLCRAVLGRALYTEEKVPDARACEAACIKGSYHSVLGDRLKARGTFREFVVFDQ